MVQFDFPENVDDVTTDKILYTGDNVEVIIAADPVDSSSEVALNMYIDYHRDFPEIVPDDVTSCDIFEGRTDPSSYSDLPREYMSIYQDAIDELNSRGYTSVHSTPGICTMCMDGRLVFSGFFDV